MRNPHFGPDPFGGKGELIVDRFDKRVWLAEVEPGVWQTSTETYVGPILDANSDSRTENLNKRWGDGQIVASIPMDILYRELMPAQKQGDTAYIKRWLNDPDHAYFRTFEGNI